MERGSYTFFDLSYIKLQLILSSVVRSHATSPSSSVEFSRFGLVVTRAQVLRSCQRSPPPWVCAWIELQGGEPSGTKGEQDLREV